jgi:DNA mismatch repair enzyme (predicted ATPase)
MAREQKLPPSAASLSSSMRDLGYSLETAVADLIDNSISAAADRVDIICDLHGEQPLVVILDNGIGMTEVELIEAMRHGASRSKRTPQDLGRFGLGLKTASFSQCRSLTVVSAKDRTVCGAEWDLDRIDLADEWVLTILDGFDIQALPYVERLGDRGTAVIWRKLDRLLEDSNDARGEEILNEKLEALSRHLSLVFHRFLSGDARGYPKLSITINGHSIEAFDPFCRKNPATQLLPEEVVRIGEAEVRMQPYILPHHSRLSPQEYDFYKTRSDFLSNQGAFIYRNGRLMAWGDWFRIVPKGEATKLARVQVDFPCLLDEAWTIDIKKSRAYPPHPVRERLKQIISRITSRSVTVHRGRGQKLFQEEHAPLWERYADRGRIRFLVNRSHPLVISLVERVGEENVDLVNLLLDSISAALPIEMIYSDYSMNPTEVYQADRDHSEPLCDRLRRFTQALYGDRKFDVRALLAIIESTHLFDEEMGSVEEIIKKNF